MSKTPPPHSQFKTSINAFESAASRVADERADRLANAEHALDYHHAFLDDILRGILPNDLVLLGAPSGVGKTDLAVQIAAANVMDGKPVAFFALEAEPREVERRIKFKMMSKWVHSHNKDPENKHLDEHLVNYADWMRGRSESVMSHFEGKANGQFLTKFGQLHTFYRAVDFGYKELHAAVMKIAATVRLIVVDHLHYIDNDDDNEARGLGDVMKMLRDMSIIYGRPILLVAHLRKRAYGSKQLVSEKGDFHGSSNIIKQATHAVVLDRANVDQPKWWLSPTYCTVVKDRRSGQEGQTALTYFNTTTGTYQNSYTLGRVNAGNTEWEECPMDRKPHWAKRHRTQRQVAEHQEGAIA